MRAGQLETIGATVRGRRGERASGTREGHPVTRLRRDDTGSATAEFVLVAALLTILTLSVMQLALALHVRNTVLDAAAEGARAASLADNGLVDGTARTRDLIATALGPGYAEDVTADYGNYRGHPAAKVTVRAPLPLIGLIGFDGALEVSGHAAVEVLD